MIPVHIAIPVLEINVEEIKFNMKTKKVFLLLVFMISLASCALDSTVELGNGYIYFSEGASDNEITKQHQNSTREMVTITIPRAIIDYEYDNCFITALQVPIEKKERFIDEVNQLKNPKKHNYWLIDKKKDKLYGPLTKDAFIKKCIGSKVPDRLKDLNPNQKYPST